MKDESRSAAEAVADKSESQAEMGGADLPAMAVAAEAGNSGKTHFFARLIFLPSFTCRQFRWSGSPRRLVPPKPLRRRRKPLGRRRVKAGQSESKQLVGQAEGPESMQLINNEQLAI
jgi:hypothetical protein